MIEELLYNLSHYPYHLGRFAFAIRSWFFWIEIQEGESDNTFTFLHIYSRNHYWGVHSNGVKIAENFWSLINEGWIEMNIHYEDTK